MASAQITLNGETPVLFTLPQPTTRITITQISAAAEAWVTSDGSYPLPPVNNTTNTTNIKTIAGVVGEQAVIQPPLYGDHMAAPVLRFTSAGSPVLQVEW
jgi:hypothetical protein